MERNLEESLEILAHLPYKSPPYDSRHWGHPVHRLISYPSKLKPSIAHFLVDLFSSEEESVLDPFSGVGTVPYEACSLGRVGYGVDLNPLAYHSTYAKVKTHRSESVKEALLDLEKYIEDNAKSSDLENAEEELLAFYHQDTLKEILATREYLLSHPGQHLLITCMAHILHGNRPYALSRRSHNIMPWPPRGDFEYKPVIDHLKAKVKRALATPPPLKFKKGMAYQRDARNLPFDDDSVDCVITSPPFHANRDFLRMNRIRLWFCGWDYNYQNTQKGRFLEHQSNLSPYADVFKEMQRVLIPGGLAVLHLGVVRTFDMARNLRPHAVSIGFEIVKIIREDTSKLESHGIRDRGATHTHQFLILRNP